MMKNYDDERVMIFIDLRNILKSTEQFRETGAKMDFEKMVEILVGDRRLAGAYMFDGMKIGEDPSRALHDAFRHQGFRVLTRVCYEYETHSQKEIDVAMACEILSHAYKDNFDTAIIVSGDRDFRPAIEHIQTAGKKAEVAGFSRGMSEALSRSCDVFYELDSMPLFDLRPELIWHPEDLIVKNPMVTNEIAS